ncbi:MAG: hypothetical protein AAF702_16000 [Chloroflexota bacterium]
MTQFSSTLLGSFAVVVDGQPVTRFPTDKVLALLKRPFMCGMCRAVSPYPPETSIKGLAAVTFSPNGGLIASDGEDRLLRCKAVVW